MNEFKYRPDIDGLRAVAIVMVVCYHAGFGFSAGFIGVDIFFVISGYLITGLILKQQQSGTFDLKDFWLRRIRRIVPASMMMTIATLILGGLFFVPNDYESLAKSSLYHQMMSGNFFFWMNSGYFDPAVELQPLLHTWSLAVEEQFYLFYPFLLWGLAAASPKTQGRVMWALFLSSLLVSEYLVRNDSVSAFYLLPSRAWEMILGGLLWSLPDLKANRTVREFLAGGSLLVLVGCSWFLPHDAPFPGLTAMFPCLATALLISANTRHFTVSGQLLGSKVPVFIGLISYSWYLWHWPFIVLLKYIYGTTVSNGLMGLVVLASLLMAVVSWRFVETPFRRGHWLPKTRPLLFSVLGTSTAIILISGVIDVREGLPDRLTGRARQLFESQQKPYFYEGNSNYEQIQKDQVPVRGDRDGDYTIMVWGDSHGMAIMPAIDEICRRKQIKCFQLTYPHTPPLLFEEEIGPDRKYDRAVHNQACYEFAVRNQVDQIVMIGFWGRYDQVMTPDAGANWLKSSLQKTLEQVSALGIPIVLLEDYPTFNKHIETVMLRSAWNDESLSEYGMHLEKHRQQTAKIHGVFQSLDFPNLYVYDPTSCFLDENGFLPLQENNRSLYCDSNHLSGRGAEKLIPLFDRFLEDSVPRTADQQNLNRQ